MVAERFGDGIVAATERFAAEYRSHDRPSASGRPKEEPAPPSGATCRLDLVAGAYAFVVVRSSSPKRARGTNRPIPGSATSSSLSTTTFPRSSTISGAPVTVVPSYRL
jgi:hypothetical protein